MNPAVSAALKIKTVLPFAVRSLATSRFFSLMADLTNSPQIKASNVKYKETHAMWVAAEQAGCRLVRDELDDDGMRARVVASKMTRIAKELEEDKDSEPRKTKAADAIANLTMALTLQLLNEGKDESQGGMMMLDDEENLDDEVCATVDDLFKASKKLLDVEGGNSEDEMDVSEEEEEEEEEEERNEDPMAVVADVCIGVLNMNTSSSNRGASVRALRDAVKRCWGGALQINDEALSGDCVKVLKEGVCGEEEEEEGGDEERGESGEEEDEEEEEEDDDIEQGLFGKMTEIDEEQEEEEDEEEEEEDEEEEEQEEEQDGSDDESVELDAGALADMLNDSDDENNLQHHEGADGALAHMLKIKAQTRKKSKVQKEQIDVDHKLRALVLLEQALGRGKVGDRVFSLLLPLIEQRRSLVNATLNKGGLAGGGSPLVNAKKSLLEKITKLYTGKLVKVKVAKGAEDGAREAFEGLAKEVRKSPNAAHVNACSLGMIACLKTGALEGRDEEVYSELLKEWSVKKNSNLQAGLFEDVIERVEERAAGLLLGGLVEGVRQGRNDFIKGEIYRLVGKIFGGKNGGDFYDFGQLSAIVASLKESLAEGLKTKRVRLVLACCEKIISYGKVSKSKDVEFWTCLEGGFVEGLMMLGASKSKAVVKGAGRLVESIAEGMAGAEKGGKKRGSKAAEEKKGATPSKKKAKKAKK